MSGGKKRGRHKHTVTLCGERASRTTQTGMLTANTNMAKQMVHAYLFRFPFECILWLWESALSSESREDLTSCHRPSSLQRNLFMPEQWEAPSLYPSKFALRHVLTCRMPIDSQAYLINNLCRSHLNSNLNAIKYTYKCITKTKVICLTGIRHVRIF